MTKLIAIVSR